MPPKALKIPRNQYNSYATDLANLTPILKLEIDRTTNPSTLHKQDNLQKCRPAMVCNHHVVDIVNYTRVNISTTPFCWKFLGSLLLPVAQA